MRRSYHHPVAGVLCLLAVVTLSAAVEGDHRLVQAVKTQNTQAVPALLKASVNVNTPDTDGTTALHWAAHWNDAATVDLLLRAGAKADTANDLRVTPLSAADDGGAGAVSEPAAHPLAPR